MYLPLESVTVVGAITSAAVLLNCAQAMAAVRRKRARARIRGLGGLQAPLPTRRGYRGRGSDRSPDWVPSGPGGVTSWPAYGASWPTPACSADARGRWPARPAGPPA